LKLVFDSVQDLVQARTEVEALPGVLEKTEHDIPFAKRYLLDHSLEPMNGVQLSVEGKTVKSAKLVDKQNPEFKIGAFDLGAYLTSVIDYIVVFVAPAAAIAALYQIYELARG